MNDVNQRKSTRVLVKRAVLQRLIRECKIMKSRTAAILTCDCALQGLVAEDVFGSRFESLLRSDVRSLKNAIKMSELELGEIVAE